MKHYILVSITIPEQESHDIWQAWLSFLHSHALHKKAPEGVQRLAANVWLLDRSAGVCVLASLVHDAEQSGLNIQARFLEADDA